MADENTRALDDDEQQADATGHDSAEGKASQREEHDPPAGDSSDDDSGAEDESEESQKAKKAEEERQQARETIEKMEKEGPPERLEDWPDDASKYETFGGPEGEHGYHEGPEQQLGPSSLRHHEDGNVEIAGEMVDDPDEYKGEPIPGGPTDPKASQDLTTERIRDRQDRDFPSEDDEDDQGGDDGSDENAEEKAEHSS